MKRGNIHWADLIPRSGSEQTGRRPVVIVSHDVFNLTRSWMALVVVPITTSDKKGQRSPTEVQLPRGVGGLPSQSIALCHQVTTLDRTKIGKKLGELPPELLSAVGEGIKVALQLE